MSKQTAVQWLQEAISKKLSSEIGPYFLDLFDQAKAMEKEQIIDAYDSGEANQYSTEYNPDYKDCAPEQFYTETYQ
jgi:hypothetical protein